jgi:hypothetical protein
MKRLVIAACLILGLAFSVCCKKSYSPNYLPSKAPADHHEVRG